MLLYVSNSLAHLQALRLCKPCLERGPIHREELARRCRH
jgi:hypothetical protein